MRPHPGSAAAGYVQCWLLVLRQAETMSWARLAVE